MKKLLLIFTTLYFFSPFGGIKGGFCQNPLVKQWDYRFGGTDIDGLTSFQTTSDSGFILGGWSYSGTGGDKTQANWGEEDYWIVKLDSSGNKQWDKDFGGMDFDALYSLCQTTDKGYLLGGWSASDSSGDKTQYLKGGQDYWIVKTDSLGNKLWDKDFGGTIYNILYSLQQTTDGGYILGGTSTSDSSGDKTQQSQGSWDYWIIKTDSFGNKQWDKDFGGIDDERIYSVQQTADGGFILGGWTNSDSSGNKTQPSYGLTDYWIVKTDSSGNKQWEKEYGGAGDDILYSLLQTADRGYILGGISVSGVSGNKTTPLWGGVNADYWIIKTDSLGNSQWQRDFGGTASEDEFGNISITSDGGYLFAGSSYSLISGDKTENNLGIEQTWVIKTDSLGNKQWDKTLFTGGHIEGGLASQTKDRCYAFANYNNGGIAGYRTQANQGNQGWEDYWIIKFCDTIQCNIATPGITQVGDTLSVPVHYATYQWYHDSTLIVGATNYFYTATTSGNYNIIVADSNGCSVGAGIINVVASATQVSGIKYQVSIFPNPSTNTFTIKNISSSAPALLQIVNAVGEVVYTETLAGKSEYVIHPNLVAGFYFAEITCAEKKIVSKLVIEK